jgi:predicted nucleic acid-binding Zn ribbon protein
VSERAPRKVLRPLGPGMRSFAAGLAPLTLLAEVQAVWEHAVGAAVAARATPTAERAGTLTVTCESAVWAQELDLMGPELVAGLNAALGADRVQGLRCQAAPARGWSRGAH